MSTELETLETLRGKVYLAEFFGPEGHRRMLQVTQGTGGLLGPDDPGFIQLTPQEALALSSFLSKWASQSGDRALALAKKQDAVSAMDHAVAEAADAYYGCKPEEGDTQLIILAEAIEQRRAVLTEVE